MNTFARTVQVTKTEAYELDVSKWADSEAIISLSVTNVDGNVTIGDKAITGHLLAVLVTGVNVGNAALDFAYSTATRSICTEATVKVIADC